MIRYRLKGLVESGLVATLAAGLCINVYANPEVPSVDTNQPDICTPVTATPYAGASYQIDYYLSNIDDANNIPTFDFSNIAVVGSDAEAADIEETDDTSIEGTKDEEQSPQSTTTDEYSTKDEVTYQPDETEQTEDTPTQEADDESESEAIADEPLNSDDNLMEESETENQDNAVTDEEVVVNTVYSCSSTLNKRNGRINGPSGEETYYNLNMSGCVKRMRDQGYDYEYWVREDGVKMYGPYIMVAADFHTRPLGTVMESSLGTAIVVDTGDFAETNPTQIDIATTW